MTSQLSLEEFWQNFLEKEQLPLTTSYKIWNLGENRKEEEKLKQLILNDSKKLVSSLYDAYLIKQQSLPKAGDFAFILDNQKKVVAVLKILAVDLRPFYQIGAIEATLDGASSLEDWQITRQKSFQKEALHWGLPFQKESLIVLEMFERLVFH